MTYVGANLDKSELLSPEIPEEMAGVVAAHGRPLSNFAHDERLPAAAALLRERVLPEMNRLNDELYKRTKADIYDRAAIQEQALKRHRDRKQENLRDQLGNHKRNAELASGSGNKRRFQQLSALAKATEGRLRMLKEKFELRLKQIQEQREFLPEWSDVTCLLIEVTP